MGIRRLRTVGVAVALLSGVPLTGACGGRAERSESPSHTLPPTSVGERRDAPDAPPPVEPLPESELRRLIDEAAARSVGGDPCPLYGVVESVVPDVSSPASARRAYRIISSALARVEARDELTEPWSTLVDAAVRAAEDAGSGAAFAGAEVRRALDALDAACRTG